MLQICEYNNLLITNTVASRKMTHKFTWLPYDGGKTTNLIDYAVVNQKLAVSKQDTRVYKRAFIDVKSKGHHLIVSKVPG